MKNNSRSVDRNVLQEGHTGVIELKAAEGDHPDLASDDPRAVKLMVDYLYLGEYDPRTLLATDPVAHVEDGLGDESIDEHSAEGQAKPDDTIDEWAASEHEPRSVPPVDPTRADRILLELHARVFVVASKYDIKSLKHTARKKFKDHSKRRWWIEDLIAAIDVVFLRTPEHEIELRNALKDAIVLRAFYLVRYPGFREAVESIDGLAYDLFCQKSSPTGSMGELGRFLEGVSLQR